ncbi:MAG: hypothetical protein ACRENP_12555 [Longimicrobiales bacterium]
MSGGLASSNLGRIGLDIYQKNPNVLYALVENQNPRTAAPTPAAGGRGGRAGGPGIIGGSEF